MLGDPPYDPPSDSPVATDRPSDPFIGLVLVPTPIGNLGDITARALDVLRAADLVLCEDSRVTARLLSAFGLHARLSPLHDHNEDGRIDGILRLLRDGKRIALVSDAGMPLLSDPGYRLVRAVLAAGLPVGGLPGANAAVLALTLSGLPPHPYVFLGFPPPRAAARRAHLATVMAAERAGLRPTLVWHEAPHRLAESLADMTAVLGDRPAAVARELTKRFEEVRRDRLAALAAHYATHEARGEVTVVVGPAQEVAMDGDAVDGLLRLALDAGESVRDAAARIAEQAGLPKREVYARALRLG